VAIALDVTTTNVDNKNERTPRITCRTVGKKLRNKSRETVVSRIWMGDSFSSSTSEAIVNTHHDNTATPVLPAGRHVWLPGRGRTFVRELAGPAGAPTIVLLHGWTATADLNWFPAFAPLAEHFRVVALDHRGHGRGMPSADPFRLADCADDVAALAEVLGIDQFVAVGYSMGGPIAQLLWHRHRHLVTGLVLCATSCTFSGTIREKALFAAAAGASVVARPVGRVSQTVLLTLRELRRRRGTGWWGLDQIAGHDLAAIVEAGRELGRFDSRSWIGAVDVPAAVLVTDDDDVVPVQRQRDLAARIPGAVVRAVAGGHSVCTAHPNRFVPALVDACRTVVRRPGLIAA
jgi:pimeloyl-ACP methyl ester carboxylesterase